MIIEPGPLRKRPQQFIGDIATADLDLGRDPFARPAPQAQYALTAECIGNELLVRGRLSLAMQCRCARCGEWFATTVEIADFARTFKLTPDNVAIDLTGDLREDIILSFPSNWLCRPDCAGVCLACGANLNKEKCACAARQTVPASRTWDALTGLFAGGSAPPADTGKQRRHTTRKKEEERHGCSET